MGHKIKKKRKKKYTNAGLSSISVSQPLIRIIAPKNISIFSNRENFIRFLNKIKSYDRSPNRIPIIFIDLNFVEICDEPSITIMLSAINELTRKSIKCTGNVPLNPYARDILDKSGFFSHLKDIQKVYFSQLSKCQNQILKIGESIIDSKIIGEIVKQCTFKLTGNYKHFNKLYTVLMEIIPNTIEHAYKSKSSKSWFLGIKYDVVNNKVIFTFVDNGSGILNTIYKLPKKRTEDLRLLKSEPLILEGVFDKKYNSRLKEENRNKGLPIVKSIFEEGYIKKLKVFSNFAGIEFSGVNYFELKNEFKGTIFYFEVDKECIEKL